MGTIRSDPMPGSPMVFQGHFYLTWDQDNNCYRSLDLDNFGGFLMQRGYPTDTNKQTFIGALVYYGTPMTQRTVVQWNEEMTEFKIATDRCAADAPPERSFEASMKRAAD